VARCMSEPLMPKLDPAGRRRGKGDPHDHCRQDGQAAPDLLRRDSTTAALIRAGRSASLHTATWAGRLCRSSLVVDIYSRSRAGRPLRTKGAKLESGVLAWRCGRGPGRVPGRAWPPSFTTVDDTPGLKVVNTGRGAPCQQECAFSRIAILVRWVHLFRAGYFVGWWAGAHWG
jgi:hypothetical protein